jgi:hypothetical protein
VAKVAEAVRSSVRIGPFGPNSREIIERGGWVHLTRAEAEEIARAVLDALAEEMPEARTVEEFEIDFGDGGPRWGGYDRFAFERDRELGDGWCWFRRTRTTYADRVTEWEAVDPPEACETVPRSDAGGEVAHGEGRGSAGNSEAGFRVNQSEGDA